MAVSEQGLRLGVDFGGTKIEAAVLSVDGRFLSRVRTATPRAYEAALEAVASIITEAEAQAGASGLPPGVAMPGSVSPSSGLVRNANTTYLNGRPFGDDLEVRLGRPVRLANDADCLALSEATDGAGAGRHCVFAAILGTGCGAGIALDAAAHPGRNGIAGEWGHTPLPWPLADETPGPSCWCGRRNCLELWLSGPALAAHEGSGRDAGEIALAAAQGEPRAARALERYIDRLGRGLAVVCDILDPDVIVLGGGVSNIAALYEALPDAIARHVFSDVFTTPVIRAAHGDSSGVRGAAWLWPAP